MKRLLAVLALAAVAGGAYIRTASHAPAQWHVDPDRVAGPVPDSAVLIPSGQILFAVPATALAQAVEDAAMADPRVGLLAGSPAEGHMTYIARSAVFGFPDLISVRVTATETGGSSLAIYSRQRFGRDDLGVNRARVDRWLQRLPEQL